MTLPEKKGKKQRNQVQFSWIEAFQTCWCLRNEAFIERSIKTNVFFTYVYHIYMVHDLGDTIVHLFSIQISHSFYKLTDSWDWTNIGLQQPWLSFRPFRKPPNLSPSRNEALLRANHWFPFISGGVTLRGVGWLAMIMGGMLPAREVTYPFSKALASRWFSFSRLVVFVSFLTGNTIY